MINPIKNPSQQNYEKHKNPFFDTKINKRILKSKYREYLIDLNFYLFKEYKTIMTKLSKFIAVSGYCSRRQATELIKDGKVTVNGQVSTEPFYEVQEKDSVKVNNKLIHQPDKKLYFLFNKPKDVICTASDPQDRNTIMDFFKKFKERLYPIGRLDRNTTGLIIVTNDGELTQKLSHPKFKISKVYRVTTHKPVKKEHFDIFLKGVRLEDGIMKVDAIREVPKTKNTVSITIHSGKKHIIKRLFKQMNYIVEQLDRTQFAGLSKQRLPLGAYRELSKQEIDRLKSL